MIKYLKHLVDSARARFKGWIPIPQVKLAFKIARNTTLFDFEQVPYFQEFLAFNRILESSDFENNVFLYCMNRDDLIEKVFVFR